MGNAPTHRWNGASGNSYLYNVYPLGTDLLDQPGNYIYASQTANGWRALYIGQTSSLRDRLSGHPEEECALRHGAGYIHAHINEDGETARRAEENDLVLQHRPPCNE
jgi:hypothetical protein